MAVMAILSLGLFVVACSDDETGTNDAQVPSNDPDGVQVGDLVCIHETDRFEISATPNRVYQIVGLSGSVTLGQDSEPQANDGPDVIWIDLDPDFTDEDVSDPLAASDVAPLQPEVLLDIGDEVDEDEFDPGDSC